jgi:hypothetical protein
MGVVGVGDFQREFRYLCNHRRSQNEKQCVVVDHYRVWAAVDGGQDLVLDGVIGTKIALPGAMDGDWRLHASEKNNDNLDRTMTVRFRRFAQNLELTDLYMHGRKFTWSNKIEIPTMSRIDRALVSVDWDLQHPDALMQALSASVSDHAPLHVSLGAFLRPKRRFHFG